MAYQSPIIGVRFIRVYISSLAREYFFRVDAGATDCTAHSEQPIHEDVASSMSFCPPKVGAVVDAASPIDLWARNHVP